MSCEWDIGGRRNGKTARLIKRANEENLYIVVADSRRAQEIAKMAREMGVDILFPITFKELPFKMAGNPYRMTHDGVLVDDAEAVLEMVVGMPVIGAAACGKVVQHDRS